MRRGGALRDDSRGSDAFLGPVKAEAPHGKARGNGLRPETNLSETAVFPGDFSGSRGLRSRGGRSQRASTRERKWLVAAS